MGSGPAWPTAQPELQVENLSQYTTKSSIKVIRKEPLKQENEVSPIGVPKCEMNKDDNSRYSKMDSGKTKKLDSYTKSYKQLRII